MKVSCERRYWEGRITNTHGQEKNDEIQIDTLRYKDFLIYNSIMRNKRQESDLYLITWEAATLKKIIRKLIDKREKQLSSRLDNNESITL